MTLYKIFQCFTVSKKINQRQNKSDSLKASFPPQEQGRHGVGVSSMVQISAELVAYTSNEFGLSLPAVVRAFLLIYTSPLHWKPLLLAVINTYLKKKLIVMLSLKTVWFVHILFHRIKIILQNPRAAWATLHIQGRRDAAAGQDAARAQGLGYLWGWCIPNQALPKAREGGLS